MGSGERQQSTGVSRRRVLRSALKNAAAVFTLAALVAVGWLVGSVRASGGGVVFPLATPSSSPISPSPSPPPSDPGTEAARQWTVAKARGRVPVYARPQSGGHVERYLPARTRYGVQTVLLVDRAREVRGRLWYRVWLPAPPNMSRGWVPASRVSVYAVDTKIVIELSLRRLQVVRDDVALATFPIAIGHADLPTPTGTFFVTERLRPRQRTSSYGVLALAISAYQPKLYFWDGQGQVAIHGTNQPQLIGQAVSHGCVRMTNADILRLSRLVSVGSPVIIVE